MILDKNLEVLLHRYPGFTRDILTKPLELKIVETRGGELTATLNGLFLHSKYDPIREAKKISSSQPDSDLYIFGGFGLGYQIVELCNLKKQSTIVIFEPSKELFLKALEVRDYTELFLNPYIHFIVGEYPESIKNFFIPRLIKTISYIPLPNRTKIDSEQFSKVEESIRIYLARLKINRNTLLKFGKLWVKNQSKNLPKMGYKGDISRVFNKFNNIPGIIISAGPSMELIIPHLKTLQNKFLILAVDTALKSLLEEGIEPDFVMSIDSQYWNARHLEGINTKKTILIADSSIQPSALREFKDRVYFVKSTFPLGQYFESKREPFPKIASGGSVSTNIWDFSLKLGLSKIFFIGQDLGFPGGITHYKNSYFEKNMLTCSTKTKPLETLSLAYIYNGYPTTVTSNSGYQIVSDKRMGIYIDWFKEKIALNSITNCFNLSPNGCKIAGMNYVNISELLKYPDCADSIGTVLEVLKDRDENHFLPEVLTAAEEFRISLDKVIILANRATALCHKIEKNFHRGIDVNNDLNILTNLDNKIIGLNQSQTLSFIIEPFIDEINESENSTALDALIVSRELYKKVAYTSRLHIKYLEQSINKIKVMVK
ncbi:MAG: DUF115 domain-containing protein [Spirochaetaceae bacterium]